MENKVISSSKRKLNLMDGRVLTGFFKIKEFDKKTLVISSDIERQYFDLNDPTFFSRLLSDKSNIVFDINDEMFIFKKDDYEYFRSEQNNISIDRFKFIPTFPETDIMLSESCYSFFYQGLNEKEKLDFAKFKLKNKTLKETIEKNEDFFLGFPIKHKEIDGMTYVINIKDILNRQQ